MTGTVTAVFENGVFRPESACDLPEGSRVVLAIQEERRELSDEEKRERLRAMVERMKANPLPPDAPRFTRDEMHERR
jgi:predicted DNA-binding antitoxin AbrB/MazE fold protein